MAMYLTAQQAADVLGVTKATLYAYTSRGQLRSEPVPKEPRQRHYYREDIERLQERKEVRRDPAKAAPRGLRWGSPILKSGITLIDNGKLYYRGQDALRLSQQCTSEEVAELLWTAETGERGRLFEQPPVLSPSHLAPLSAARKDGPLRLLQAALPLAGADRVLAADGRRVLDVGRLRGCLGQPHHTLLRLVVVLVDV